MALFRRRAEEPDVAAPADRLDPELEAAPAAGGSGAHRPADGPADRHGGPRDRSEVTDTAGMLDFWGAPPGPRDGMQAHLETDEAGQGILAVTVLVAGSAVQAARPSPHPRRWGSGPRFAARSPRASSPRRAGPPTSSTARSTRSCSPGCPSAGRTAAQFQPARFIGVDGPRWFLRAVVSGAGAADPTQVAPALAVVRDVVVSGQAPMAPRDLLPLTLPVELSAAPEPPQEYVGKRRREDDLRPFDRGPEITEIH